MQLLSSSALCLGDISLSAAERLRFGPAHINYTMLPPRRNNKSSGNGPQPPMEASETL